MRVMILHMVVKGVVRYRLKIRRSIKWSTKTIESQGYNLGSHWTFFVLTAFQTEIKDIVQYFVAYPAL